MRVEGWIACQEGEVLAIVGGREVAEKKKSSVQNAQYTEERSRVVLHDPVGPVRHVVVRTGLSSTTRWGQFLDESILRVGDLHYSREETA